MVRGEPVQQRKPGVGEFGRGEPDGVDVGYLEFDAGLRNRMLDGPVRGAKHACAA